MINYLFDLVCFMYFKALRWLKFQKWNWFTSLFIGMPLLIIMILVTWPIIAVLAVTLKVLKPLVGVKELKITKFNDDIEDLIFDIKYADLDDEDDEDDE